MFVFLFCFCQYLLVNSVFIKNQTIFLLAKLSNVHACLDWETGIDQEYWVQTKLKISDKNFTTYTQSITNISNILTIFILQYLVY